MWRGPTLCSTTLAMPEKKPEKVPIVVAESPCSWSRSGSTWRPVIGVEPEPGSQGVTSRPTIPGTISQSLYIAHVYIYMYNRRMLIYSLPAWLKFARLLVHPFPLALLSLYPHLHPLCSLPHLLLPLPPLQRPDCEGRGDLERPPRW